MDIQTQRMIGSAASSRGHGADVPARFQRLDERLMREDVEFCYLLALHILLARKPKNIHQSRFVHSRGR